MANSGNPAKLCDRILLVESDPTVSDLIGRQALQSAGYQVQVAFDANTAIATALQWAPDLILVDLELPGLSGKDLMVALTSQGMQIPLIAMAHQGMEMDLIQAFRLGAADYLILPAREAEVVNAVGRVLQQVHDRHDRDRLAKKLEQANYDLQARVRELTTIFALGKAITSVTDQAVLLKKILNEAVRIAQADFGWFLLREDIRRPFVVVAQHNLPDALGVRQNQPWDDGISSLVAVSGEILAIHDESLKRFKIASLGQAALIVPVKVGKNIVGLLVMVRRAAAAFQTSDQHLLMALADYASISLVNARLFRGVEERARSLQKAADSASLHEKVHHETLQVASKEISASLQAARASLDGLAHDALARWRPEQRQQLASIRDALLHGSEVMEQVSSLRPTGVNSEKSEVNLVELIRASLRRFQPYAQRGAIQLQVDLPVEALPVRADSSLLGQALDGIISNAIKHSPAGAQVSVRLRKEPEGAHLLIHNGGRTISESEIKKMFDEKDPAASSQGREPARFGGIGIPLRLIKEIILRLNGKIWLESQPSHGTDVHIRLPVAH